MSETCASWHFPCARACAISNMFTISYTRLNFGVSDARTKSLSHPSGARIVEMLREPFYVFCSFPIPTAFQIWYVRAPQQQQLIQPSGVGTLKLTYTPNPAQPQTSIQYAATQPKVSTICALVPLRRRGRDHAIAQPHLSSLSLSLSLNSVDFVRCSAPAAVDGSSINGHGDCSGGDISATIPIGVRQSAGTIDCLRSSIDIAVHH